MTTQPMTTATTTMRLTTTPKTRRTTTTTTIMTTTTAAAAADRVRFFAALAAAVLFLAGCAYTDDAATNQPAPALASPDDDANAGGDASIFPPDDGRLYAGASRAVITPNAGNHPETIYLGGLFPSRVATGVHDDLLASVVVLARGAQHVAIVSLDLLGFSRTRGREIQESLAAFGIDPEHVLIAATHTHEAPDTLGVFGPDVFTSGVSPDYMRFVQDAVADAVLRAFADLTPVTLTATAATVKIDASNFAALTNDFREPIVVVPEIGAMEFVADDGRVVATVVNGHSHPEVMLNETLVSSDFPSWLRRRVEERRGGVAVYISGAVGGLATPTGVSVPARDEAGDPIVDDSGDPLMLTAPSWDKARSLGVVLADFAVDALDAATPEVDPGLYVDVRELVMPVESIVLKLAFLTGLIEYDARDLRRDMPGLCGAFGCASERLAVVGVGPLMLVSSPGETFAETWIGREETTIDFEGWGEETFGAIRGLVEDIAAPVAMHIGLCGNEIGYLIPEGDFHTRAHPDYYEEDLFLGYDTETIYRETARAMILRANDAAR
ncbi:hypothetical protein K8I61_07940 [bacterium]|nr:hypothetical protein [bacterium]